MSWAIASAPMPPSKYADVTALQLAPDELVLDDLAGVQVTELGEGLAGHGHVLVGALAHTGDFLLDGALAGTELRVLGTAGLELGQLLLEVGEAALGFEVAGTLDLADLALQLGLEARQVGVPLLLVDLRDEVGGEVDDLLELLGLQLLTSLRAHEQVGEPGASAAQVPDVHDRGGELDVAHALAPDLRARDLDATPLADDAPETDPLVLAAVALPVLRRTEDLLAEESVLLGTERAVVDRLRLADLAVRPVTNVVGGSQPDTELIEVVDVEHLRNPSPLPYEHPPRRSPARGG